MDQFYKLCEHTVDYIFNPKLIEANSQVTNNFRSFYFPLFQKGWGRKELETAVLYGFNNFLRFFMQSKLLSKRFRIFTV